MRALISLVVAAAFGLAACQADLSPGEAAPTTAPAGALASGTTRPTIEGEPTDSAALNAGDCFNRYSYLKDYKTIEVTTKRPCDQSHDAEVFFKVSAASATAQFDNAALTAFATTSCYEQFEPFVGKPFETSQYKLNFLLPTDGQWDRGLRSISCFVTGPTKSAKLTGSARGTRT